MRARVAPHMISPVMTSSMLTGVAIMALKVFWVSMRMKEAQPHSPAAAHMGKTASSPGAMNSM